MCQPLPLYKGARGGSWLHGNLKHQLSGTVDHPMVDIPRTTAEGPELCARAPCRPNQEHCLLHSMQGQQDLVLQPSSPHSCALQKTLNSPNQGLQENQIPNSYLLETTLLPGVPWPKPHTSPSTVKSGDTLLIPFSCLYQRAAGRKHFPQKIQPKQELSVKNFFF